MRKLVASAVAAAELVVGFTGSAAAIVVYCQPADYRDAVPCE